MQAFRTHLLHSPHRGQIERVEDALVSVSDAGEILDIGAGQDAVDAVDLRGFGLLLPGFVDLHIHAPQFPQLGAALDVPLEEWLLKYTFPLEARYADLAFATEVYQRLVRRLLSCGTTTAVYFATLHGPASLKLAETCLSLGQRAWVGRVAMDLAGGCPEYYRDKDAQTAVADTASFIDAVRALPGNSLVEPVITPRFIPACSDAALKGLGDLAATTGAPVQTHCSESDWEHGFVLERMGKTDTAALDDFGLLTRRCVLAHAGHITEADMALIADRGAGIAHCPLSNAYFGDAVFPLRRALAKALRVGLGTDISGGYSAFLLDNARAAVTHSRMLESGVDPTKPPGERGSPDARVDFRDAFYLATKGGAKVLDLPVGSFEVGRQFDAVLVDFEGLRSPTEDALQKIVLGATPENIKTTWVAGRKVSAR
ncbi:MAG: amidohydrolase family protein [Roseobacter sp.]